jgi:hypothetical protein
MPSGSKTERKLHRLALTIRVSGISLAFGRFLGPQTNQTKKKGTNHARYPLVVDRHSDPHHHPVVVVRRASLAFWQKGLALFGQPLSATTH